jgi:DNA-binding transcriptional regulator YdaS (Cro superfamily)
MNLKQYFKNLPRGSKKAFADKLKITPTYLGLLIRKARRASPALAKKIQAATNKSVTAKELRPDVFG